MNIFPSVYMHKNWKIACRVFRSKILHCDIVYFRSRNMLHVNIYMILNSFYFELLCMVMALLYSPYFRILPISIPIRIVTWHRSFLAGDSMCDKKCDSVSHLFAFRNRCWIYLYISLPVAGLFKRITDVMPYFWRMLIEEHKLWRCLNKSK